MARFDRKVERTKKEYQFTQKEKVVETNKDIFKKNFNLKMGAFRFKNNSCFHY